MSKNRGLSPSAHIELGRTLKRARELLLEAGMATRCYGKLSRGLFDAADALTEPRAWLEKVLIDAVGEDAMVEGVHCRDVYFGSEMEVEDA
jgi:hypothetical protein